MTLQLSEDLNVYVDPVTGASYHRVTNIIRDVFGDPYAGADEDFQRNIDHAAERGKEVDRLCCAYAKYGGYEGECDDEVAPRLAAFDRWWQKTQPEYVDSQVTVYSDEQQVAGTLDLLVRINGYLTIVDLKCTANMSPKWSVQLGAYRKLHDASNPDIAILHLNPKLNKHGYRYKVYNAEQCVRWWNHVYAFWLTKQELGV